MRQRSSAHRQNWSTPPNRRRFPRRHLPFHAVYFPTQDARVPAVGLDIGGGGLCLLLQEPLAAGCDSVSAAVLIGNRPVPVCGVICWQDTVTYHERTHYRYGLKFTAIKDADWEYLMQFAGEVTGGENPVAVGGTLTKAQSDLLVPYLAQRRIVEELVWTGRLDPPRSRATAALVEYRFDGYTMRQGVPYVRLTVRSKRSIMTTVTEYQTKVLVPIARSGADAVILG